MTDTEYRKGTERAWAELDMENLRHNVRVLKSLLPENCELMPAVKANAYGHGAVLISRELNAAGVNSFCVASVAEGIELRENGIEGEILVLGYTHPDCLDLLEKYDLIQTVLDAGYGKLLGEYGKNVNVHIKIDTGMHRLGERAENIDAIAGIFGYENLNVMGAYTHLCAADSRDRSDIDFTHSQIAAFGAVLTELRKRGFVIPKVHTQASYGIVDYPEAAGDYARPGIALYGLLSTGADTRACKADLRPVLSLKARVAETRELRAGEGAGYGLAFTAERDTKIAIIAIGYADGLPRALSNGIGSALVNGCRARIAGRVCMDQILLDITDIPSVRTGDVAVLIGRSGDLEISACELADGCGTITNETLSRLGTRLERITAR